MSMSESIATPTLGEVPPIQRTESQTVDRPGLPVARPSMVVVAHREHPPSPDEGLEGGEKDDDDDTDLESSDPSSPPLKSWLWPIVGISWLVILVGVGVIIWQVKRIFDSETVSVTEPTGPPTDPDGPVPTLAPTTPPIARTRAPTVTEPHQCFTDHAELMDAVDDYMLDMSETSEVALRYGWPMSNWCTGDVTSFESLFDVNRNENLLTFNEDVGQWNTSSVTNMKRTFRGHEEHSSSFNKPLDGWQTDKVTTMENMFEDAGSFNQPLDSWDVSKVEDFRRCFLKAEVFNQNLSSWRMESATGGALKLMFTNAKEFNGDISNFDVSRITDMSLMFFNTRMFTQDISGWNVSQVTNFDRMFAHAWIFNVDLSSWQIHPEAQMSRMFDTALAYNHSLCAWGSYLNPSADATDMFVKTGCLTRDSPNLTIASPGPFCHACN